MASKKPVMHSGSGKTGQSIIEFVICFAILLAALYILGTYPDSGPWWFAAVIPIFGAAYFIPQHLLGSKTNTKVDGDQKQNLL